MKDIAKQKEEASDIQQFFDEMAVGRDEKIQSNPVIEYEQQVRSDTVLSLLAPGPNEKILDVGCGNARDILPLVAAGARVVGVDISAGMVEEARRGLAAAGIAGVELRVGDCTQLEFPDGEFDKVLCSEVIEHIPDAPKALREIWRVLKPGGRLVLSTPNPSSWYGFERYVVWERLLGRKWNHPFDHWRRMGELKALVEEEGFVVGAKAGACYVPGFLVTYFMLPRFMQRFLVTGVGLIEPVAARWFSRFGYMVCLEVTKPAA